MSETLLAARGLGRSFSVRRPQGRPGTVWAVRDVSLEIRRGETLGLVGESGCGKSTLGRLLALLVPSTCGELEIAGRSVVGLSRRRLKPLRRCVQMVFQDPVSALNPRHPVAAILTEPLRNYGIGTRSERLERAAALLEAVGLSGTDLRRYPHELSGGQRQRVALARALILDPGLVVADEPVSALDVSIRRQILDLLTDLKERFGLTYLFIGHDLAVVRQIADRVAVMYLGRIVELAPRDRLFASPAHPYTRALLEAVPRLGTGKRSIGRALPGDPASALDPPPGCPFHPRCRFASAICRSIRPEPYSADGIHWVACHHADALQ
ncbi:MAG TPA: oligopeptide/dipeptide ABC transporter ATP-binding protein [Pseudomonadales bacterium]